MIKQFKEVEVRESAVIYQSTYEKIKKLYAKDPEQAGELAIAAVELALTGEISTDDFMIDLLLEDMKVITTKNKNKYDKKVEAKRQQKIEDQQLAVIAELYLQGMKQKDIAAKINTTPQTVSNRLATIRTEYSYLLEKNQVNQENQTNQEYDNVNDNDNVNVNMEKFEPGAQIPLGESCAQGAQSSDGFTF